MRLLLAVLLVGCGSGTVVLDGKTGGTDTTGGQDSAATSEGGGGEGGDSGGADDTAGGDAGGGDAGGGEAGGTDTAGGDVGGDAGGGDAGGGDAGGTDTAGGDVGGGDAGGADEGGDGGDGGDPPANAAAGTYVGTLTIEVPDWGWECSGDLSLVIDDRGAFDQTVACTYDGWGTYDYDVALAGRVDDAGDLSGDATVTIDYLGDVAGELSGTAVDGALKLTWEATVDVGWGDPATATGTGEGTRE